MARLVRSRSLVLALAVVLFLPGRSLVAQDALGLKLQSILHGPDYAQARWGVLVVEAKSGRVVFEREADRLFTPASVTKLYSCAAALAAFGPDYRFETPVYRRGTVADGRLAGDLVLVASGDPTLGGRTDGAGKLAFKDHDHIYANFLAGSEAEVTATDPLAGLTSLARQVREAGIRQVTGEVLVDDRLFARARGTGSGPDVLSPVAVNDNVVDVLVRPAGAAGQPAAVALRPATALVQMDAQVATVAAGQPVRVEVLAVGPGRFAVRGQVPAGGPPVVRIYPVEDPAWFARGLFIEVLRREGVGVEASPLTQPAAELPPRDGYDKAARVAVLQSPPFAELMKVTLKVSHNLYASMLPLLLASRHGERTLGDGLKRQREALAGLGVPVGTICFGGGAGGSPADMVTPRATVGLLRALAGRPDYGPFRDALPVLGVDGTLVDVLEGASPARGKVFAKTGTLVFPDGLNGRTLLRSKALAGVMTTARGTPLVFAIFVNDVPLPPGVDSKREGKVLGKLCELLYQEGP